MKKNIALVGLGLAAISFAHAESRLFPTDILNRGELDAQFLVVHDTHSANINFRGNPGSGSLDLTSESIQVRYGLGANWHVGAALRYVSQGVSHTDYSSPSAHYVNTSSEGRQNPDLWASYGFINDKANPFSLKGELLVGPNTTGKASTYTGKLMTGWKSSDTLKLYGVYSTVTKNDSSLADSNSISVGAYKDISTSVTLIPHASYIRFNATNTFSSTTQYDVGLSSNIQISRDTYLIPNVIHYWNSTGNSSGGFFHRDASSNGTAIILDLYHLF